MFGVFGTASVALGAIGTIAFTTQGLPERLAPEIRALLAYKPYPRSEPYREGRCFLDPPQSYKEFVTSECIPTEGRNSAILFGDSFAAHHMPGLGKLLVQQGVHVGQLTASTCPPIVGQSTPTVPNCSAFKDFALSIIETRRPELVIMSAVWSLLDQNGLDQLVATIDRIAATGARVVVLGQSPLFKSAVPDTLARRGLKGATWEGTYAPVDEWIILSDRRMRERLAGKKAVTYLSILDVICHGFACPLTVGKVPLYWDTGHLTIEGAKFYGETLLPLIYDKLN